MVEQPAVPARERLEASGGTVFVGRLGHSVSAQDCSMLPYSEVGTLRPEDINPFGKALYRRAKINDRFGRGHRDYINISDDIYALVTDFQYNDKISDRVDGVDLLKFHFKISGNNIIRFGNGSEHLLRGGRAVVALHPKGLMKDDIYSDEISEKSLTLCCRPHFLSDVLELDRERLPLGITRFLWDGTLEPFCYDTPMNGQMMQSLNALLNPVCRSEVRHIHVQARALELVCMLVDSMMAEERPQDSPAALRGRDIDALYKVRSIVEASLEVPPTIPDLARQVGMNRTKLMQAFKQMFGETISDFSQRTRLERALCLLRDTDAPVSVIAADVGYEHQSSFAVAFKAHFGMTAREIRQR